MSKGGRERKEGGGASKLPEFDSLHMCHGESDSGRLQSRSGGRASGGRASVAWSSGTDQASTCLQFDSQFSDEFACHTSCGKLGH